MLLKRLQHRLFLVNITKFLRKAILKNICERLLLYTNHKVNNKYWSSPLRGCSYGGELAQLGGLAHLGEIIFIPRSYGIFCLSSI